MAKKKDKPMPEIEYFIDGKAASQLKIIETDDNKWKKYLEENKLRPKDSKDLYLTEKLGEYITARQINKLSPIKGTTLNKWRENGSLKGVQLGGIWYYSFASLKEAIKSADNNDFR